MVSKNTAVRSIRLPNETWEWLATEAEKRGTTVNGLVAEGVAMLRDLKPKTRDFARNATVTVTNRDGLPTRFQGVDVAKGQTVQFGPTPRKPGDLAKKGTKK